MCCIFHEQIQMPISKLFAISSQTGQLRLEFNQYQNQVCQLFVWEFLYNFVALIQQFQMFELTFLNKYKIFQINLFQQFIIIITLNFIFHNMLDRNLIDSTFADKNYSLLDYLSKLQTFKLLSDLNEQQFDNQTFQQMWDQCKMNSKGQIKLQNMMETFIKAQLILNQRDKQIQAAIQRIQQKQIDLQQRKRQNQLQLQQLTQQLQELKEQRAANSINLQIIRKPFRSFLKNNPNHNKKQRLVNQAQNNQQKFQIGSLLVSNTQTYSWIFQLTFILLLIQLPIVLYYSIFVNVFLFLFIMSTFVSGYFCRIILRIELFATIFTLIVDIIWYCVEAKTLWNLSQYHDWPFSILLYLKITVILFSVTFIGKIILCLLFISEYNSDESQNKKVSFFNFWKFELSHQNEQKNMYSSLTSSHLPNAAPSID